MLLQKYLKEQPTAKGRKNHVLVVWTMEKVKYQIYSQAVKHNYGVHKNSAQCEIWGQCGKSHDIANAIHSWPAGTTKISQITANEKKVILKKTEYIFCPILIKLSTYAFQDT